MATEKDAGMRRGPTETELAKWTIAWLENMEWDVYQEVTHGQGLPRADIVAKRGTIIWVIETKLSFGLSVLQQAHYWRAHTHMVSVATWLHVKDFGKGIAKHLGVGIISPCRERTTEIIRPALNRNPLKLPKLHPEHKVFAEAGSNGSWYTPFQRTSRIVAETVKNYPGLTMKELVSQVDHHYASAASARQSLKTWIEAGKISGVEAYRDGKTLRCRPVPSHPRTP